jgi:hypothetical protein
MREVAPESGRMTAARGYVSRRTRRFKTPLALVTAFALVASAFAQKPAIPKAAENYGNHTKGEMEQIRNSFLSRPFVSFVDTPFTFLAK